MVIQMRRLVVVVLAALLVLSGLPQTTGTATTGQDRGSVVNPKRGSSSSTSGTPK